MQIPSVLYLSSALVRFIKIFHGIYRNTPILAPFHIGLPHRQYLFVLVITIITNTTIIMIITLLVIASVEGGPWCKAST